VIPFDIFRRTALLPSFVLKIEVVFFFEILAVANKVTRFYSRGNLNLIMFHYSSNADC
jgi:hypothetical protein